jgi:hypothetical protein
VLTNPTNIKKNMLNKFYGNESGQWEDFFQKRKRKRKKVDIIRLLAKKICFIAIPYVSKEYDYFLKTFKQFSNDSTDEIKE